MPLSFERSTRVPAPVRQLERWHRRPAALLRLIPPWSSVRVVQLPAALEAGARATLEVRLGPLPVRWVAEHEELEGPGPGFRDVQVRGPFRRWEHAHRFASEGDGSRLTDTVECELPLGPLGRLLGGRVVRGRLGREFAYRHRVTRDDVAAHASRPREMEVAVTGASGTVGSVLTEYLRAGGHRVLRLTRREPRPGAEEVRWDPVAGYVDTRPLEGIDGVVHLAGESPVGLWTEEKKAAIRESRVQGTRALAEALAGMDRPPEVLVSASAVGYYGDRGEERLTEGSLAGDGFMAGVARAWEEATAPASSAGIRVVRLRMGMVLTPAGGALARMVPAFQLGLGATLGTGRQHVSWIAVDDVAEVIHHALASPSLEGPVNAVAPEPVRNRELTRTLGRVLSRWTPFRVPLPLIRLVGGEMVREMLLPSQRVVPAALEASGYDFRHPELEPALRHLLGRPGPGG